MENRLERFKTLLQLLLVGLLLAVVVFVLSNATTLFHSYVNKNTNYTYRKGHGIDSFIHNFPNKSGWQQIRKIAPHTIEDIDLADSLVLLAIEFDDPEMKSYGYIALGSLFATEGNFTKALELADNGREIARNGLNTLAGRFNPSFYLYDMCYANRVMGFTYRLMNKDSEALIKFSEAENYQTLLEQSAHNCWPWVACDKPNRIQNALLHSNMAYSYLAVDTGLNNDAETCWQMLDDTTSMIRARYWHIKARLAERGLAHVGDSATFVCDTAQIRRDYDSCFLQAAQDSDRRSRLTYILSHLDYGNFLLRMGKRNEAATAITFALKTAKAEKDTTADRAYLQQATVAADSLRSFYRGQDAELLYANQLITAKKKMDEVQYKHMEVNMRLVERIREKEEQHEKHNDHVLLCILGLIAILYGVVAAILILARIKDPAHKKHKHLVGYASGTFVFIVELSAIFVHHEAGKLTQNILGLALILIMLGFVFHAFEDLLFHEEEKQAVQPVMTIRIIRTTVIKIIKGKG